MIRVTRLFALLVPFLFAAQTFAQTGKIAGQVSDAESGMGLPGVNVSIEGTTQGAVTDVEGYYQIINVRPGTYEVRASFVGYTTQLVEDVRVSTGLTTELDFVLREEILEGEEVVVTAERPIVQLDVSANVASLDPADFENLPVAGVSEVIDLQAGIEPGLQIRGGGMNEVAFVLDGLNLRTGRDQNPFTNISYTSLEQVQVQTGGFNAEYGNVRAGVVNVTTKEPSRTRYSFDGLFRYQPIQDKSSYGLGQLPEDLSQCGFGTGDIEAACNTWWTRPALDPEVAMDGTSAWDPYTRRQYQDFEGWNSVADRLQADGFDVTADDLLEYFKYTHRKDNSIQVPDYEADVTLGGPLIPGLSRQLGDLRFLVSYRGTQTAYVIPQDRNHFGTDTWQGKLSANPRPNMKLTVQGMRGTERGITGNADDRRIEMYGAWVPRYPWGWAPYALTYDSERGRMIYSDAYVGGADIDHTMFGGSFTHSVNANTFYEVSVTNVSSKYRHRFLNLRDGVYICPPSGIQRDGDTPCTPGQPTGQLFTDNFGRLTDAGQGRIDQDLDGDGNIDVRCFGGGSDLTGDGTVQPYCVGEEPLGLGLVGGNLLTQESTGGHWDKTRDTTDVSLFTGKFDLTSQVNRFLQLKTGAELIIGDYAVNTLYSTFQLESRYSYERWDRSPIQGGAYLQGKLEFQGMIANLGLRADYFDANSQWWVFSPYDQALRRETGHLDEVLPTEEPSAQLFLSPRLGVSFPITENSKLYFNYGHFRQMLQPFDVFGVQASPDGGIDVIGNPDTPMPKTVAYELGFDQNILDRFLLRVSGFYRDIRAQARGVTFTGLGAIVQYETREPWNYEDIRGFEISLSKNSGRFFRGFLNYTFTQTKNGNFGYSNFYENSFDMLNYLRTTTDYRQSAPIATPFARFNFIFLTPVDYGPGTGFKPLADWRLSLLGEWRAGAKFTWTGASGNPPELQDNVQWRDFWNWNLRLTKNLGSRFGDFQVFAEMNNVLNRRHIWNELAFHTDTFRDQEFYMKSLHLPEDIFDALPTVDETLPFSERTGLPYIWVPGNDQPGDFRDPDVGFQPIEAVATIGGVTDPNTVAWYWAKDTGTYSRWNGSAWEAVPQGELDEALDKKAYIDMPNMRWKTFMNPRTVLFGVRITL